MKAHDVKFHQGANPPLFNAAVMFLAKIGLVARSQKPVANSQQPTAREAGSFSNKALHLHFNVHSTMKPQ
jgi:hypothetical protein